MKFKVTMSQDFSLGWRCVNRGGLMVPPWSRASHEGRPVEEGQSRFQNVLALIYVGMGPGFRSKPVLGRLREFFL